VKSIIFADPSLKFMKRSDFYALKGKNIFEVDLRGLQRKLQFRYPQLSLLTISKRFPNQIVISARKRTPFAQALIRNRAVTVDDNGVVLSTGDGPDKKLPLIVGAKSQILVLGQPLSGRKISIALDILNSFHEDKNLLHYTISKINVTNLSKIVFSLSNELHIMVDADKIKQKISILGDMLKQGQLVLKNIKYIDLRFKGPIIGRR